MINRVTKNVKFTVSKADHKNLNSFQYLLLYACGKLIIAAIGVSTNSEI